jgi:type VI secretion system protein ImpH
VNGTPDPVREQAPDPDATMVAPRRPVAAEPSPRAAEPQPASAGPAPPTPATRPPAPPPIALPPGPPLARLVAEPARFDLEQAATLLAPEGDMLRLDFRTLPRLGLPHGEVAAADAEAGRITATTFGLIGPGGVLPRHYTATVAAELRKRSGALHAFLDLLARRFTARWIMAGAKYRPTRNPEPASRALAAAVGLATPHLAERLASPLPAVLYHAGNLAARTRSAERLRALLEEEAGCAVEIVEFDGGWLRVPESERTRLPTRTGPHGQGRLGVDAMAGAAVYDPQSRIRIRFGPLSAARFAEFLPGRPLHRRLAELTRLFLGPEMQFVFNPVLRAAEVPNGSLGAATGARLGWTSWLAPAAPRRTDAADAVLAPVG